ncbi:DUF6303 family protein [Streptomyces sp. NPDC046316]|uniref:DUF6303 family protein n=1 Tax=Streptomyces sp. NPDC046316 TaxID=3154494 RepID=UPI0033D210C2
MTPSARLVITPFGEWELYVVDGTRSMNWPVHDFGRAAPIPTPAERISALASLGYKAADGASWEWQEMRGEGPVRLLAALDVRLIGAAP